MDEKIELIHTMAYQQFIPLFVRAGLEIDENEECPEGLITCLELKDCRTEKTVGAAVLVYTENVYVIKAVAVEKEYRGNGLGVLLVREILNEAERRGADKVFLNAKIPDFYQSWDSKFCREKRLRPFLIVVPAPDIFMDVNLRLW